MPGRDAASLASSAALRSWLRARDSRAWAIACAEKWACQYGRAQELAPADAGARALSTLTSIARRISLRRPFWVLRHCRLGRWPAGGVQRRYCCILMSRDLLYVGGCVNVTWCQWREGGGRGMAANFWVSSHWYVSAGGPAAPAWRRPRMRGPVCVCALPTLRAEAVGRVVRSQVWLKETKEENLSEDDKRRVALRNKRNAEIFNPETMEEDIKRLRVHLAFYLQSMRPCLRPRAVCSPAAASGSRDPGLLALRVPWRAAVAPWLLPADGRSHRALLLVDEPLGALRRRHSSMVDTGIGQASDEQSVWRSASASSALPLFILPGEWTGIRRSTPAHNGE